jgi:hypothetical protein
MRIHEAIAVFRKYGVDVANMPIEEIRKIRNALIHRYHPDVGGTLETAQEINAAFDLLRSIAPDVFNHPASRDQPGRPQAAPDAEGDANGEAKPERVVRTDHDMYRKYGPGEQSSGDWQWEDQPAKPTYTSGRDPGRYAASPNKWAWAGHFGRKEPDFTIAKNDFTDVNFIKRSLWELSGHSNDEWTISGYDGKTFQNNIIAYGSPKIFHYMAISMIDYQTKGSNPAPCRAVLARLGTSSNLFLIYADGKYYDQNPVRIRHEPIGSNPQNYTALLRQLPEILDKLKQRPA